MQRSAAGHGADQHRADTTRPATAFVVALLVLAAIGFVGYRNTTELDHHFEWVEHTYETRAQLQELRRGLLGVESARRGFAITGDDAELARFDAALERTTDSVARLRQLTSDNAAQQRRLSELAPLVTARTDGIVATVASRRSGFDHGAERASTLEGTHLSVVMDDLIAGMDAEERQLLIGRAAATRQGNHRTATAIVVGTLVGFAILITVFILLRREIAARALGEERLRMNVEALTEGKKAERDRDRLFELSIDLIAVADVEGSFLRVNPSFEAVLGYTAAEITSRPFIDFVHPEDREQTIAQTLRLAAGERTIGFENRYACKDGSYRWLEWTVAPDLENKLLFAVARDTTAARAASAEIAALNVVLEQRLLAVSSVNEELETFSYSVSHDLRAPLRGIDGFSQALLEDYGNVLDATAIGYLARIRAATQRMGQLIEDLLKLSKITRATLERQPTDVSGLARAIVASFRAAEPAREVVVEVADGLHAFADTHLLEIALDNLLRNAWKFTSKVEAARIEVGAHETPDGARGFFVKDNGAGFDMAYASKLFGAFQRLHAASEFGGTGIGLATVRRIVARHEGRVWADSRAGEGASFFFTL